MLDYDDTLINLLFLDTTNENIPRNLDEQEKLNLELDNKTTCTEASSSRQDQNKVDNESENPKRKSTDQVMLKGDGAWK